MSKLLGKNILKVLVLSQNRRKWKKQGIFLLLKIKVFVLLNSLMGFNIFQSHSDFSLKKSPIFILSKYINKKTVPKK